MLTINVILLFYKKKLLSIVYFTVYLTVYEHYIHKYIEKIHIINDNISVLY